MILTQISIGMSLFPVARAFSLSAIAVGAGGTVSAFQLSSMHHVLKKFPRQTTRRHPSSTCCRLLAAAASDNDESEPSPSFIYTVLDDAENNEEDASSQKRDLAHVLQTMERAAYFAGQIALSTAGKIAVKTSKANAKDLVTESDIECQRLIKDIILSEFPNDVFLGEEDIDLSGGDSSVASSDALKSALGITAKEEGGDSDTGSDGEDRLLFVVVSVL